MNNNHKIIFISIVLAFILTLNACAPQATPTMEVATKTPLATNIPATTDTPPAPSASSELSATLSEATGEVEIRQSGQDTFQPIQADSLLDEGGQAQTGSDGRLRLDISTGTIIRMAPSSLFTLTSNQPAGGSMKTRLELILGKLYIILNGGSMEVETPTGTAAVRGSFMSVGYDSSHEEIRITCLEGHCALRNAWGSVEITAGQTALITGIGHSPVVGEMTDQDFQDWLDNCPEAKLIISALTPPATLAPTISAYVPPVVKPTDTEKPKPTKTPITVTTTATPALIPIVTIAGIDPAGSVVGEPLYITIGVAPSTSGPVPTGTVKVFANGKSICSAYLDAEGYAYCVGGIASAGSFSLVASYSGDSVYKSAQSAPWDNYVVAKASTTTTITSHIPNPSLISNSVTFTATVDIVAPGAGTPFGSVTFSAGAYTCTVNSAPWTCSINLINPGPTLVTASYSGDANFTASNSASITQEMLLSSDTEFRNASGPVSAIAACNQVYKVDVLDVDSVNSVYVEYSINDNTFNSPVTFSLTKTGVFTWEATQIIAATATDTVSWRFVANDGASNQFFFGGTTPYFPGSPPVDFYSYSGIACP